MKSNEMKKRELAHTKKNIYETSTSIYVCIFSSWLALWFSIPHIFPLSIFISMRFVLSLQYIYIVLLARLPATTILHHIQLIQMRIQKTHAHNVPEKQKATKKKWTENNNAIKEKYEHENEVVVLLFWLLIRLNWFRARGLSFDAMSHGEAGTMIYYTIHGCAYYI